jgi:hypothetical protein
MYAFCIKFVQFRSLNQYLSAMVKMVASRNSIFSMSILRIFFKTGWWISVTVVFITLVSCSHSFDADTLDLRMYQWNLWVEPDATWSEKDDAIPANPGSVPPELLPGCGWDKLHRGMGKLVRIPTSVSEQFTGTGGSDGMESEFRGVAWYHCRFSLPELWKEKPIILELEEAGPRVDVFLNEDYVGGQTGTRARFILDVSGIIYHTRDNHLAIRISDPEGSGGGITGPIHVKPGKIPVSMDPG